MTELMKIRELNSLIKEFGKKELIVNVLVGAWIVDLEGFKFVEIEKTKPLDETYKIGFIDNINFYINPNMRWTDIRIFDDKNNVLLNLEEKGFNSRMI